MNPFKFFDTVYCLNLPEMEDRWVECISNFKKYEVDNYTRFEATRVAKGVYEDLSDKRIGQISCALSFCQMIDDAIEKEYKSVVFLEDDFDFIINPLDFRNKTKACFEELPENWDMLYFGANVIDHFTNQPLEKYSENLLRLKSAYALHSVAISRAGLLKIKDYFKHENIPWGQQMISSHEAIDVFFAQTFQPNNECFISSDLLVLQRPSFSKIEGTFFDYSDMMKDRFNYFKSRV